MSSGLRYGLWVPIDLASVRSVRVMDDRCEGMHPGHVAINADGTRTFVSNVGDNTVSVIEV